MCRDEFEKVILESLEIHSLGKNADIEEITTVRDILKLQLQNAISRTTKEDKSGKIDFSSINMEINKENLKEAYERGQMELAKIFHHPVHSWVLRTQLHCSDEQWETIVRFMNGKSVFSPTYGKQSHSFFFSSQKTKEIKNEFSLKNTDFTKMEMHSEGIGYVDDSFVKLLGKSVKKFMEEN